MTEPVEGQPPRQSWADLWAPKSQPRPAPLRPVAAGEATAYAEAALADEAAKVLAETKGGRNHQLNKSAFAVAQLVAAGHITQERVDDVLRAAALTVGLEPGETEATLRSGARAGAQYPRQVEARPELRAVVIDVDPEALAGSAGGGGPTADPPAEGSAEEPEPPRITSWWPLPLTERAAEAAAAAEPTHLARTDGRCLFYRAKVNTILGEAESGKSWLALKAIIQALARGERVLLLDFEDSPDSIYSRLQAMGLSRPEMGLLDYANPTEGLDLLATEQLGQALAKGYGLVVADGLNAALTLLGYDLNDNTEVTLLFQKLLRPIAGTGACVITVDHVPKDPDRRGKGAIGAQAKRALIDGCSIRVEVVEPFGAGQSGELKLWVDKDRPGKVRGVSQGAKLAGRARLTSISGTVDLQVVAPDTAAILDPAEEEERAEAEARAKALQTMEEVSRLLEKSTQPLSGRTIRETLGGRATEALQAIHQLVQAGYVLTRPGPKRSTLHVSRIPFRVGDSLSMAAAEGPEEASGSVVPEWFPVDPGTIPQEVVPGPPSPMGEARPLEPLGGSHSEPGTGTTGWAEGESSCNGCGQATPDHVLDRTGGYCLACKLKGAR